MNINRGSPSLMLGEFDQASTGMSLNEEGDDRTHSYLSLAASTPFPVSMSVWKSRSLEVWKATTSMYGGNGKWGDQIELSTPRNPQPLYALLLSVMKPQLTFGKKPISLQFYEPSSTPTIAITALQAIERLILSQVSPQSKSFSKQWKTCSSKVIETKDVMATD